MHVPTYRCCLHSLRLNLYISFQDAQTLVLQACADELEVRTDSDDVTSSQQCCTKPALANVASEVWPDFAADRSAGLDRLTWLLQMARSAQETMTSGDSFPDDSLHICSR